jgi:hypothetical protein
VNKFLYVILLSIISLSANALNSWSVMSCSGADTAGKSVYLTASSDSSTVTINGDVLRIMGKTRNNLGVYTESFIATSGIVVYDSLVPITNTSIGIYQFNAVTEALLAKAALNCTFSGNGDLRVADQQVFNALKASAH